MISLSEYDDDCVTLLADAPEAVLGKALIELSFLMKEELVLHERFKKIVADDDTILGEEAWAAMELLDASKERVRKINATRKCVQEALKK